MRNHNRRVKNTYEILFQNEKKQEDDFHWILEELKETGFLQISLSDLQEEINQVNESFPEYEEILLYPLFYRDGTYDRTVFAGKRLETEKERNERLDKIKKEKELIKTQEEKEYQKFLKLKKKFEGDKNEG